VKQHIVGKTSTIQINGTQFDYPVYAPIRGDHWAGGEAPRNFRNSGPWSSAGTFSNLYVEIVQPVGIPSGGGWPDIDFELYINDAPTGLMVTVPGAGPGGLGEGYSSSAQNTTDTATIAAGDTVNMTRGEGTLTPGPNTFNAMIAWSLTFDSDADGESGYQAFGFNPLGGNPAGNILKCPILPNSGGFALAADAIDAPGVHGVVPMACTLTRIDVLLDVAPGMGESRTFCVGLNNVAQNGDPLTIDTRFTISDLATSAVCLVPVPLAVLDWIGIWQLETSATPAAAYAACSICLTADVDGQFALNFYTQNAHPTDDGTTDYGSFTAGGWAWTTAAAPTPNTGPDRWPMSESDMSLPGPLNNPFTLSGLCANFTFPPGTGKSYDLTTRRALADTPGILTMADSDVLAVGTGVTGTYSVPAHRMDLQSIGVDNPAATQIQWTWLVTSTPVPPIVSTSYPIRRLRRFALPFILNKWIKINRVELIMQAGNGLSGTAATVQGYNPIVMFRLSRDGGTTWDDELQMETGKIGEYTARAFLHMLGRARNPVVELTSSDPVFVSWIDFTVDYDEGTS
jgi:hypothetical protein